MITNKNSQWYLDGKHIKTNSELYQEAVEKDNHRVSKEWNALGVVSGSDPAAIQLAATQGNRSQKLAVKYGYAQ